ncbi:tRNA glutamyl-Q(34) synthetase GluQRS [Moraxella bovis]|uniref:tRNA glutamyl-Q(34) synthetase GluQRS n=1 Tax=Moraxella bovis TaxID=476 RepID=A0AAQ2QAP8_MORBO|nr:tRNA glutamyl-Q(34) synthetase GluQRS [Moraxella bovis]AWY19356.1 tRNA glutamyl-Q(34) synthetase GluQRS [Moraxella bovis]OOR89052.1 tRNA glutamyl-Q(34) synthetase GluQRS [Moraxella bovis]UYZ68154.1 tRNA glutamyl-Q(34) synthetase GluQRS [Moraxella bovis]UYZ70536.1 tRNA glutamyl-Q(34) synthetase GluQRS [Moraxella bovis]UYZ73544.1 tRNA glutamyl-Q(34) synthetase GluQRS [Moraxella bovis]
MNPRPIIGRFAPSPTGALHLGSLCTALASYCHIKSLGGQWLVRIEDVDFERCKPDYAVSILTDLENLGLYSDGEILFQSKRTDIYDEYLAHLSNITYHCTCSRKELSALSIPAVSFYDVNIKDLHLAPIYPRLCLHKNLSDNKIRLCLPDMLTAFFDGIQGVIWDNPAKSLGDVVVKRQNGMINYILACTIDDGLQGITHVMRGLDIMPMTVAQLCIAKACLLPTPHYFYHLPLLVNHDGQKLSKQNLATPIDTTTPDKVSDLLFTALTLLGQNPPAELQKETSDTILMWATRHWDNRVLEGATLGMV